MKITMRNSEDKGSTNGSSSSSGSAANPKIRIAVFGQHDVGKSARGNGLFVDDYFVDTYFVDAQIRRRLFRQQLNLYAAHSLHEQIKRICSCTTLTVRYLTKRYIGEYKSNTDILYRQTLSISHGTSVDIEIVDISAFQSSDSSERKTFPAEELPRADGFIIVYSITDRSSFTFAQEVLSDIFNVSTSVSSQISNSNSGSPNSSPQPKATCPVALVANKNDLEHLRTVDKMEGITCSMQYGCQFYELSVAENSAEVYTCFQSLINTLVSQYQPSQPKRKFSVSKMLGNLRLGRMSPSNTLPVVTSQAIVDINVSDSETYSNSAPSPSKCNGSKEREHSPFTVRSSKILQSQRNSSQSDAASCSSSSSGGSGNGSCNNLSSSICNLKSKLVELHSMKKRHNSPPICSL